MINSIQLLGLAGGTLTTISLIPQLVKSVKTKSTKDISLIMFLCTATGTLLWLAYGILRNDIPVIAANSITFLFASAIIILKLKYR